MARRQRELAYVYGDEIGGWGALSLAVRLKVQALAELAVVCELERSRLIAGDGNASELVRLERLLTQAERRLGIGISGQQPEPAAPTLEAYLAGKVGATP